jgi:hypothetical protein
VGWGDDDAKVNFQFERGLGFILLTQPGSILFTVTVSIYLLLLTVSVLGLFFETIV